ncbi:MAG: hypothetical protein KAT90_12560, partial [Gammaproteobacteria bacterium]|nr:hypothetical protein [Gammaproteobacteria bacterium]
MQKQNLSFVYFFAWLVIGVFFGLIVLLYRGDIQLQIILPDNNKKIVTDTEPHVATSHTGFADAVIKAAPAVVSIQTISWSEAKTDKTDDDRIIEKFLGIDSPHSPKRTAETNSGSGVIIDSRG